MHELSIATEIITIAQKEMTERRLDTIKAVGVRLGALSGIDPEALSFGFQAGTIDTPLADVELIIEQVPVKGRCRSCGRGFQVDEFIFLCPHCQSTDMELTQGEELEIAHLIVE